MAFINRKEAASILKMPMRTLERWMKAGKITFYKKLGGRYYFDKEAIDNFLNEDAKPASS